MILLAICKKSHQLAERFVTSDPWNFSGVMPVEKLYGFIVHAIVFLANDIIYTKLCLGKSFSYIIFSAQY